MRKIFIRVILFISLCLFSAFLTGCETTLKDWVQLGGIIAAYVNNDAAVESVKEYRGIDYFEDEQYLDFDRGSAFKEIVEQYEITEYGEVVDFYHCDYSEYNKRYFGESPNSYILDVQISDEDYETSKSTLTSELLYRREERAYELYEENITDGQYGTSYVMLGFSDAQKTIRVLCFLSNSGDFSNPGPHLINKFTNPEMWKTKTEDGSVSSSG